MERQTDGCMDSSLFDFLLQVDGRIGAPSGRGRGRRAEWLLFMPISPNPRTGKEHMAEETPGQQLV